MAAFDLLGRRWAMGIIWNLNCGPATFRQLQTSCQSISPSVLNSRLRDLREAGLIEKSDDGYILTEMGEELFQLLKPFGEWAISWARQISSEPAGRWDRYRKETKD